MKGLTELLKGALEGIVLQRISQGETYGYEITNYLIDLGFEDIVEGTVYTVLLRLEKKGYCQSNGESLKWGHHENFTRLMKQVSNI